MIDPYRRHTLNPEVCDGEGVERRCSAHSPYGVSSPHHVAYSAPQPRRETTAHRVRNLLQGSTASHAYSYAVPTGGLWRHGL